MFWSFWLAISEPGWTPRGGKPHLESGLNQRGRAKSAAPPIKKAPLRRRLFFSFHGLCENAQKGGMFYSDSAGSPHRTAKPSRGCLPLAHPRALPAVILPDRRSPSAMSEFPFEWWGCIPRRIPRAARRAAITVWRHVHFSSGVLSFRDFRRRVLWGSPIRTTNPV